MWAPALPVRALGVPGQERLGRTSFERPGRAAERVEIEIVNSLLRRQWIFCHHALGPEAGFADDEWVIHEG